MNQELKKLFEEDQQDLKSMISNRVERDRFRRARVREILEYEGLTEAIDYIHAAIIFQHGETLDDWWQAHLLAVEAVKLGFKPKWIAAVALDRWLLRQGLPLKYGNQVLSFGGIYRVPNLEEGTTDEERALWDVPSKAELLAFENLRGFIQDKQVCALEGNGLKIIVRQLERHPAHSPALEGTICGFTQDERPIYRNSYDWQWVNKKDGTFDYGWMLIPHTPVIAHVVAEDGDFEIKEVSFEKIDGILVTHNEKKTFYFRTANLGTSKGGVQAITAHHLEDVRKKAALLMDKIY